MFTFGLTLVLSAITALTVNAQSPEGSTTVETSSVQVTCCPVAISPLPGQDTLSDESPPTPSPSSGETEESTPSPNTVCTANSKFCLVLKAATEIVGDDEGPNPEIVATIAVHESGRLGCFGFGMADGRGGYVVDCDERNAVESFLRLVSNPHYALAWSRRGSDDGFLDGLVAGNYSGGERAWAGKILWFRDWLMEHERW